jgi:predicted aspartyl protease
MIQSASSSRFPYLTIHVQIGRAEAPEQELELEPLVDTGFDGGVAVPQDAIDPSITPYTHLAWQLADQTEVYTPAYLGSVKIGQLPPVETIIIALGETLLLGRGVTNHFRLIFDRGQRVIAEP